MNKFMVSILSLCFATLCAIPRELRQVALVACGALQGAGHESGVTHPPNVRI